MTTVGVTVPVVPLEPLVPVDEVVLPVVDPEPLEVVAEVVVPVVPVELVESELPEEVEPEPEAPVLVLELLSPVVEPEVELLPLLVLLALELVEVAEEVPLDVAAPALLAEEVPLPEEDGVGQRSAWKSAGTQTRPRQASAFTGQSESALQGLHEAVSVDEPQPTPKSASARR